MKRKVLFSFILLAFCLSLFACGPSQAELDAQATKVMENFFATQTAAPTSTPTLAPTPTATPTPIPGKFINPPEFLETVFYPDWFWMYNAAQQRTSFMFGKLNKFTYGMYYAGNYEIGFSIIFNEPTDDERQVFNEFVSSALLNYVSTTTQEKIIQFVETMTDFGSYKTEIDSFNVVFTIKLVDGKKALMITIGQIDTRLLPQTN